MLDRRSLLGLFLRPWQSLIISLTFLINTVGPICPIACSAEGEFRLPAPGVMVHLSPQLDPPILKGIKVHPNNPFLFDFILDQGDSQSSITQEQLKQEATKLIKYFLASLTIPEKDLWVNLSPYEKDRIIPQGFGLTEMGRDLLAEDYMLKQITASLIYPEDQIGKKFWKRIYEEATKKYGTTNVTVNTFNKVWIMPEKAIVYENAKAGTAYVVESKLKVMLEQDYLSLEKHDAISVNVRTQSENDTNALGSQIVREIVIPQLSKEVNEDKNFARLRQVYNSLILAIWYKKKIKDSILAKVYEDKNKVAGVNIDDPQEKEKIYQRYLQAFKKGVYNYIREEPDLITQETIPRKYFSGGVILADAAMFGDGINSAFNFVETLPNSVLTNNTDQVVKMVLDPADMAMRSWLNHKEPESPFKSGWAYIDQLIQEALLDQSKRKENVNKIIVYLRLREKSEYNFYFRKIDDIGTDAMRENLIKLLECADIPLYKKRLLLECFPRGETYDYKTIKNIAVDLEDTVKGKVKDKPRSMLVGWVRSQIHDRPELPLDNIEIVEAYKAFVASDGREQSAKLVIISNPDINVTWLGDPDRKAEILRICTLLLVTLKKYANQRHNTQDNKVGVIDYMEAYTSEFLQTPERHQVAERIDLIMRKKDYGLKDLRGLIEIRQELKERMGNVKGVALLQGLKLDLYLENFIQKVFITMKEEKIRFSPEALLLMLENNRFNGYGGELVDQQVGLLEDILREKDSKDRDMQLFALFQRSDRVIKRVLEQGIDDYQKLAEESESVLKISGEQHSQIVDFTANIFRDNTFYMLSILLKHLRDTYRDKLGLSEFIVVQEGEFSGNLHYVKNMEGIKDVRPDEILVMDYLPPEFPEDGEIPFRGIIVYELDSLLYHPAINAKQNKVPFIVAPKKTIKPFLGTVVSIVAKKESVTIEEGEGTNGNSRSVEPIRIPVRGAGATVDKYLLPIEYRPETAGPKAYNLMLLDQNVPLLEPDQQRYSNHMVLSETLYEDVLNLNGEKKRVIASLKSYLDEANGNGEKNGIKGKLASMRENIESLVIPETLLRDIRNQIRSQIPEGLVFLRSSSNAEDLDGYSGAGLYESIGAVDPDNLPKLGEFIKQIWASVWKDRTYGDRKGHVVNYQDVFMSVLVHEMVDAQYSYLIHTINPANNNPNEMVLEIVQGLGEGLVSGVYSGTPHRFIYNRLTGEIRRDAYSSKDYQLVLRDGELKKISTDWKKDAFRKKTPEGKLIPVVERTVFNLFRQAIKAETYFRSAQDMEGCIEEFVEESSLKFKTVVVQSRDQSVDFAMNSDEMMAQKGKEPVSISDVSENGGIDLTSAIMNLQTRNMGGLIQFHPDLAMLKQLQNAPGFIPTIINIQPMNDLRQFLELPDNHINS